MVKEVIAVHTLSRSKIEEDHDYFDGDPLIEHDDPLIHLVRYTLMS